MRLKYAILIISALSALCLAGEAKTVNTKTVRDGGSGPWKAIAAEDDALPGRTVFRPENLSEAAQGGKLPVILFGNGGCSRSSEGLMDFLIEVASHGYIIITPGIWGAEPPSWTQGQTEGEQHAQQMPRLDEKQMKKLKKQMAKTQKENVKDAKKLLKALTILGKQAEYKPYVDVSDAAASGQSCGGLQALLMGISGDRRIRTVAAVNSGVIAQGLLDGMISREDLRKLSVPVAYIIGGPEDIAYPNSEEDFKYINHVPVTWANCQSGHAGPYLYPDIYASVYIAWMDWQLKGIQTHADFFRTGNPDPELPDWMASAKNHTL